MSTAWEVTVTDVENVLKKHNIDFGDEDDLDDILLDIDISQIEDDVLKHTDFDDQVNQGLSSIEDQLMENDIIKTKEKLFTV